MFYNLFCYDKPQNDVVDFESASKSTLPTPSLKAIKFNKVKDHDSMAADNFLNGEVQSDSKNGF